MKHLRASSCNLDKRGISYIQEYSKEAHPELMKNIFQQILPCSVRGCDYVGKYSAAHMITHTGVWKTCKVCNVYRSDRKTAFMKHKKECQGGTTGNKIKKGPGSRGKYKPRKKKTDLGIRRKKGRKGKEREGGSSCGSPAYKRQRTTKEEEEEEEEEEVESVEGGFLITARRMAHTLMSKQQKKQKHAAEEEDSDDEDNLDEEEESDSEESEEESDSEDVKGRKPTERERKSGVPFDFTIEERPGKKNPERVDKYYFSSSGKQYRSISEIKRNYISLNIQLNNQNMDSEDSEEESDSEDSEEESDSDDENDHHFLEMQRLKSYVKILKEALGEAGVPIPIEPGDEETGVGEAAGGIITIQIKCL